jgi:cysteine desulfurase
MKTIYLDHHASTPVASSVEEAMAPFWRDRFGNPHSSEHVVGLRAARAVDEARGAIASALSCGSDEIFFSSGATEANNHAIFGVCASPRIESGRRRVIVSEIEHKCVLEAAYYWCKVFDLELLTLRVNKQGFVDLDQLSELVKVPTRLISVMAVNNEIGTIQDINALSSIAYEAGAIFHSDCSQLLKTKFPFDIGYSIDVATFSGHKLGGPPGIGVSYVGAHLQGSIMPLILGGGQQNGIRSGTVSLPLAVGLGAAFELISRKSEVDLVFEGVSKLRTKFYDDVTKALPDVVLNGPAFDDRHCGNLNIQIPRITAAELLSRLMCRIAVSSGSACSGGTIEASHVLKAIGLSDDESKRSIRLGFSESNTLEEVECASNIFIEAVRL